MDNLENICNVQLSNISIFIDYDRDIIKIKNKNIYIKWVITNDNNCVYKTFEVFDNSGKLLNSFDSEYENEMLYYFVIEHNLIYLGRAFKYVRQSHQKIYNKIIDNIPYELQEYIYQIITIG